jgi:hypothetical protein
VVETERYHFLGERIVTLSSATHIKLDAAIHAKSHRFSLLPSNLLLFIYCSLHHTVLHFTMINEVEQVSNIASDIVASAPRVRLA